MEDSENKSLDSLDDTFDQMTMSSEVSSGSEVAVAPLDVSSPGEDMAWQSKLFTPTARLNGLLRHAAHSDLTVIFPATGKAYKVTKCYHFSW